MNLFPRLATLAIALILASCAIMPHQGPRQIATLSFQNGQTTTIRLDYRDPALTSAFMGWVQQGIYANAPVYRQLPGIFVLTGKPRLSGQAFIPGTQPTRNSNSPSHAEASTGQLGLVVHEDGTVGPEIILVYGHALVTCCQAPANIRIGTITGGQSQLKSVERGDNLTGIAIQP